MFYPQTKSDNDKLENFKAIRDKYKTKLQEGHIIKKANSIYPRLDETKKRGKRSAEEVVEHLCIGLIDNPHFSIIYDIIKDNIEINYDENSKCFYSTQLLSFINLSPNTPLFNQNTKLSDILKQIKDAKFNAQQLTDISKFVMRLSIY